MNLLPEEEKKEAAKERMRRLATVLLLGCAGIFWMGTVLLLPSYFFTEYERREFVQSLEAFTASPEIARIKEREGRVQALGGKALELDTSFANTRSTAGHLQAVLEARGEGVQILSLSYATANDGGKITVAGRALSRTSLRDFSKRLEARGEFKKVISPVSNFLKEENLEFSLSLELAPAP